jgi:hypothetical protein
MFRKSVGKFWISHQDFSQSVGNFVSNGTQSEMHLIPVLWNSLRPSVNLSVMVNYRQRLTDCNPSTKSSVIVAFATLQCRRTIIRPQSHWWWWWHFQWSYCEMSMAYNSFAKASAMMVAFPVKLLWNADGR